MDRSPPEVVNAEAQGQARKLTAIVRSATVLGLCFLGFGLLGLAAAGGSVGFDLLGLAIASSLMSSGVMYVVFAMFLRKRRYWAWLATLVMTIVLLLAVWVFAVFVTYGVVAELRRAIDPEWSDALLMVLGPGVWMGSWIAALILILRYLVQSLPAVREQEAGAQMGFAVIPVARVAEGGPGGGALRDAARERAG